MKINPKQHRRFYATVLVILLVLLTVLDIRNHVYPAYVRYNEYGQYCTELSNARFGTQYVYHAPSFAKFYMMYYFSDVVIK